MKGSTRRLFVHGFTVQARNNIDSPIHQVIPLGNEPILDYSACVHIFIISIKAILALGLVHSCICEPIDVKARLKTSYFSFMDNYTRY